MTSNEPSNAGDAGRASPSPGAATPIDTGMRKNPKLATVMPTK